MKQHGFNSQQVVHQRLLRKVIAPDFETAAQMLSVSRHLLFVTEKMSRAFDKASCQQLARESIEPEDKIVRADAL